MSLIRVEQYNSSFKTSWDEFISKAKNSHFFFRRDFIEYHSDRFTDHSLLFFDNKDKLISILPANIDGHCLYSHQGLSFGAFLTNKSMTSTTMLNLFEVFKTYLNEQSIQKFIYKPIPYIYHKLPSQEDLYALHLNKAKIYRRDLSSTIELNNEINYQERRRRALKKALDNNLKIEQSQNYESFWEILSSNLKEKYNKSPVHSLDEIKYLASKFPENIKLFVAHKEQVIVSGVVMFETKQTAHTQYLASNKQGHQYHGLDAILDFLITDYYQSSKRFFDFGISTEDNGNYLNKGLVEYKEGFGARTVVFDHYELT